MYIVTPLGEVKKGCILNERGCKEFTTKVAAKEYATCVLELTIDRLIYSLQVADNALKQLAND